MVAEYPHVTMNIGPSNGEALGEDDDFVTGGNSSNDSPDFLFSW
jgi:hypothetical protein